MPQVVVQLEIITGILIRVIITSHTSLSLKLTVVEISSLIIKNYRFILSRSGQANDKENAKYISSNFHELPVKIIGVILSGKKNLATLQRSKVLKL
jgi:hypothetical protein